MGSATIAPFCRRTLSSSSFPHAAIRVPVSDSSIAPLLGIGKAHFVKSTADVDVWDSVSILAAVADEISLDPWDDGELSHDGPPDLEKSPVEAAAFAPLPADLAKPKKYVTLTNALKDHLYRVHRLTIWKCKSPKAV